MPYLMESIIAIFGVTSGVVLSRWWDKRRFRLLWVRFPPNSMMTIHDDVSNKLEVTYGGDKVTNLTKRRFLLRNTGYKAIEREKSALQWQAPGPVLEVGPPEEDSVSPITVAINADDRRKIDIQWENYLNPKKGRYIDVIYDDCKKRHSLELLGSRKDTTIINKSYTSANEQLKTTQNQVVAATFVGLFLSLVSAFLVGTPQLYGFQIFYMPLVTFFVTYTGVSLAFKAHVSLAFKAHLEHGEKRKKKRSN